jgi:hypothetical protein
LLAPYPDLSGRICSVLAPRLHKKFLAAYVTVFMKRPIKLWGIKPGRAAFARVTLRQADGLR